MLRVAVKECVSKMEPGIFLLHFFLIFRIQKRTFFFYKEQFFFIFRYLKQRELRSLQYIQYSNDTESMETEINFIC
jgi:hypothetical protein